MEPNNNTKSYSSKPTKRAHITAKTRLAVLKKIPIALKRTVENVAKILLSSLRRLWRSKIFITAVRFIKKHKRIITVIIVLMGSHLAVYSWANSKGFESGKQSVINSSEHKTKTLLDKKTIPYRSLSGSITKLNSDNLTIRTIDGMEATFTTNDNTKYSQQSSAKKRTDLKVGSQVTVFATDNNSVVATHVVIVK